MIQDVRASTSTSASQSSAVDKLEQQLDQLFEASRSFAGSIDTRQLAQNVVAASGGDSARIDTLSQAAGNRLSPVDQGSFGDFLSELIDAITDIFEKIVGGEQPSGPPAAPASPNVPGLPPVAGDSARIPGLERIANDPAVRSAIDASWNASNPNTPGAKQETGFWVVRDDRSGQLSTVAFPSNGTRDSLTPGPVPQLSGKTTVAFFHTHPNTAGEGYISGPSTADQRFADNTGIPGIIRSHDGMYFFNP
jgi:hypothetical protein